MICCGHLRLIESLLSVNDRLDNTAESIQIDDPKFVLLHHRGFASHQYGQPVLDVIKPFMAVNYSRKLCRQCYKTCLRPYFTPTEPSSGVITRVKSRHWQRRNISYGCKRLHNIQHRCDSRYSLSSSNEAPSAVGGATGPR